MEFNRGIVLTIVFSLIMLIGGCYTAFNFDMAPPTASVETLHKKYGCDETCYKVLDVATALGSVGGEAVGGRPADQSLGRIEKVERVQPLNLTCVYVSPDGLVMWLNEDATVIRWDTNVNECHIVSNSQ